MSRPKNNRRIFQRVWGSATGLLFRKRGIGWVDLLIIVALAGLLFGLIDLGREWTGEHRPSVEINLSPWRCLDTRFFP